MSKEIEQAHKLILEDRERREKLCAEKIQAVLDEYRCQQFIVPGDAVKQPGGVTVIGPPSLMLRALD